MGGQEEEDCQHDLPLQVLDVQEQGEDELVEGGDSVQGRAGGLLARRGEGGRIPRCYISLNSLIIFHRNLLIITQFARFIKNHET